MGCPERMSFTGTPPKRSSCTFFCLLEMSSLKKKNHCSITVDDVLRGHLHWEAGVFLWSQMLTWKRVVRVAENHCSRGRAKAAAGGLQLSSWIHAWKCCLRVGEVTMFGTGFWGFFFLLHILIIYRVCFVEVSAGVVTLGIHSIQVWGPNTGRVGTLWRGSTEEGHEGDPRAGAALLWIRAEGTGVVQSGKERAVGKPNCGLPVFIGSL